MPKIFCAQLAYEQYLTAKQRGNFEQLWLNTHSYLNFMHRLVISPNLSSWFVQEKALYL